MTTQTDAGFTLGIDIGGTFTDIVCRGSGREVAFKTPTTPHDQSEAVSVALRRLHDEYGIAPTSITRFVHGTTVSTNALIERRGARLGLIMTEGFGDTIEIGRQIRRQLYDLALKPETPGWLAPGARRAEVKERVAADGSVVEPLDDASLAEAIDRLDAQEVEAIAVCLLFSFSRPEHELRVRDAIRKRLHNVAISLSHEVDPTFREYERTVATAFDAYVKPVVDRYLQRLSSVLSDAGSPASVQVMQSRGGLSGVDTARARPIRLTLSGPAAGVIGAVEEGVRAGSKDLISIDIGGTSSDIALIRDGQAAVTNEAEVAGYKVRVPMLDVVTLGAGGGSIAWLDAAGGLKVGPHSAGSDPGPACYGAGGTEPTVTDASIVLGFLNPNNFAGGTMTLDPDLSWRVIEEKIATPMGLSVEDAAAGIHKIANAHMADGIRLVSLRRGHDPRDFALLGLGGGGGVHAAALSEEIGISRLVMPQRPGVLSAAGLLSAPIEHEVSVSHAITLANADMARIREVVEDLHARAATLMRSDGASDAVTSREVIADLAYVGQSYTLAVPFHPDASDALTRAYSAFEAEHERVNGLATGAPGKLVNLRVVQTYQSPAFTREATHVTSDARETTRRVIFPGHPPLETRVIVRAGIAAGTSLEGPLVIEQRDATTLVPPGWRAYAHESGALVMERTQP